MSNARRPTLEFAPGQSPSIEYFVNKLQPHKPVIIILPFCLFVLESLLANYSYFTYGHSDPFLKLIFVQLLAVNSVLAGLLHFFPPMYRVYTSMIFLPFKAFWLYATGVVLLLAGLGVVFDATQVVAAKCLVAILICMFPANIACVFMEHSKQIVFGGSTFKALLRLPMQLPLISWAWWFTTSPSQPTI